MSGIEHFINEAWESLLNKDDRTSPPEYPEMCLITRSEFEDAIHMARWEWAEIAKHGIDIQDLRDLEGGSMGFWSKGHHQIFKFAEACNAYTGADAMYDKRHVRPDDCRHEWWRTVPMGGLGMVKYLSAEPKSRGAFAVTVTTIIEDRDLKQTQREIDQHNKGAARGFADGLNWALRQLDSINLEAGQELLRRYRENVSKAEGRT